MLIKRFILFVFLIFITFCSAMAQIIGIDADYQSWINYTSGNKWKVRVFAFNQNQTNLNNRWGKLKAISPDSTGGWSFQWSTLDLSTFQFNDTLAPIINADSAVLENLNTGCYRVRLQKGSIDTFFVAWVLINPLRFHLLKTDDGFVKDFEYSCDFLDLRAIPKSDTKFPQNLRYLHYDYFLCPNPETGDLFKLNNDIIFNWSGSDGSVYTTTNKPQVRITSPPAVDTRYKVTAKDLFGNQANDEIVYKTINTKADFKIYLAEDTMNGDFKTRYKETNEGEAKLWAKFINLSKNGARFTWQLSDYLLTKTDSLYYLTFTSDSTDTIKDIVYTLPRTYKVKLISESPRFCIDSIVKEIIVKPSKMGNLGKDALPKVFTPNGDGVNDYFYIKTDNSDSIQSIEYLSLRIYNSRGTKVFEYKGKVADGWKGWDGKTYLGLDAPAGIYYYYFEAKGYGKFSSQSTDNTSNSNSTDQGPSKVSGKGYFYLFRE